MPKRARNSVERGGTIAFLGGLFFRLFFRPPLRVRLTAAIATGSSPVVPPIPGLETVDYFTNESLFQNTVRPEHLIIIGGGPIGLEMAQAHRRLGSRVTVIEGAKALGKDDPE